MKKTLLLLLVLCAAAARAESDIRSLFLAMPDSLLPTLSRNNRLDLLDFHDNHMESRVKNVFDDDVLLVSLAPDCLTLRLSALSQLTLVRLDTNLVAEILTVGDTERESTVSLRDTSWAVRPSAPCPPVERFLDEDTAWLERPYVVASLRELPLVRVEYLPEEKVLEYTLSLSALDSEARRGAAPRLHAVRRSPGELLGAQP